MKLTKSKLKQIIKEELDTLMNEEDDPCAALERKHERVYAQMQSGDPYAGVELGGLEKEAAECPWYLEWSKGRAK